MMKKLEFFVTGASGFIGSKLVAMLNRNGHKPYVLLRRTSRLDLLEGADYAPIYGDITHGDVFTQLPESVNAIVHCAGAIKSVNKEKYIADNVQGTVNLLEGARRRLPGLHRVILLSSQAAAGPCRACLKKNEEDPCNPVSLYGISKLKMEEAVLERFPDIPLVIVRPPTVYGPGDHESLAFFKMVKSGFVPAVNQNRMIMSFLYIDDLLEGIYRLATAPCAPEKLYFMTSQDEVSLSGFLEAIAARMGKKYMTIRVPKPILSAAAGLASALGRLTGRTFMLNPDKVKEMVELRWVVNGERFRSMFQDMRFTPLDRGIEQSLAWYIQKGWL